jgi:purine-nucleoside phosphorylase
MESAGLEYTRVQEAAEAIQRRIPFTPGTGIILGTGLGEWLSSHNTEAEFSFSEIPHLLPPSVISHSGKIYAAFLHSVPVILFSGRTHFYEGYSMQEIARPVRVMHALGCRHLILTNAAGSIHPDFNEGDIIQITDHINLTQLSPLQGSHDDRWGTRFPDMRHAYDPKWLDQVKNDMKKERIYLRAGVYAYTAGSNLETTAEYEFLYRIGADMVGMSTVPEVIAARQLGLKVLGLSIICNVCYPPSRVIPVTEQSAIQVVFSANGMVKKILEAAVSHTVRR